MAFPEWVEKQKKRGQEIKKINGKYYVYERKSRWDPQQKKSKKKTGEYLGRLTQDGFVPKRARLDTSSPILSMEYGASRFLAGLTGDLLEMLRSRFGDDTAERVYASAMMKIISPCPFRRVGGRYETSFMSWMLPGLALSPASMTGLLDRVGRDRRACAEFMRDAMEPAPYVLIDGTGTQSSSGGTCMAMPGHSNRHGFLPQVNQVYVLSAGGGGGMPAFYRNVAGNIPDVTAFELTVEDAGVEGVTVIADAGFASGANFDMMAESGLSYIVPLKRNTSEVDLGAVGYDTVFTYHHRAISAHAEEKDGYRVCVFRDEKLRADEMADFVGRGEKANAAAEEKKGFDPGKDLRDIPAETGAKNSSFGTIILRTSLMETPPQEVYGMYKLRWEIEQLFDTMRNSLDADTSSMQDDEGFEAWSFVNHVMLIAACRILAIVREKNLAKQYSLSGIMDALSRVHMVQIASQWKMAETTKKTKKMLNDLVIDIEPDDTLLRKKRGKKSKPMP
jgi:hypothetical protein